MKHKELLLALENLTKRKVTQREIAEALGFQNVNTIGNRAMRNSDYSVGEVERIYKYLNIKVPKDVVIGSLINRYQHSLEERYKQEVNKSHIDIDYYPDVFASCGNGTIDFNENNKELMAIDTKIIHNYNSNNKYAIITAKGDSMSGVIEPKDKLIVRQIEAEPIVDNHIYVFAYRDEIYIKFLSKNIDEIMIRSNNPDYKTKYITDLENLRLVGEVVGIVRNLGE